MEDRIEKAYLLAKQYHAGQTDKAGADYIEHPLAVARLCETEDEKITALLHDTLEDTDLSPEVILEQFGPVILEAVRAMTRAEGESYMDFIRRAARNPIAARVKMADLTHNSRLERLITVTQKDLDRVEKYKKAMAYLRENAAPYPGE